MATSNLTSSEQTALSALAAGARTISLLSPGGATNAAVSDILSAAGSAVQFINTANAALTALTSPSNDPIAASFSTGQPYGGTFITSPTVTQLTPVDFSQALSSSTQSLSQLSSAQQSALSAQTGVTLNTDADLATAMATVFSQAQANFKLAFSVDLTDASAITPVASTTVAPTATTVAIPPLTLNPDMTALSNFVAQIAPSFSNVPGIEGVAAGVWTDGLGVSVGSNGNAISGIPTNLASGPYSDISSAAGTLTGTTPVTVVDYSFQQNQFNVVAALAIDHGLTNTLSTLMTTSLVNKATSQVIINRLASVAQRGDASMLNTMFNILGLSGLPNSQALLTNLLYNLRPSDQTNTTPMPTITSGGVTLDTASNSLTTAQLLALINIMLLFSGLTIQEVCSQNTCDSVLCSLNPVNVSVIKSINRQVITSLLDAPTVSMAYMFA